MQMAAFVLSLGIAAVGRDAPPPAEVIERQVLDQRLLLQSGRITLTVDEASRNLAFHCEMLFDGPKRRVEITRPPGGFPATKDGRGDFSRLEKYIVNEEHFLHHVVDLGDNNGRYVAHVEDLGELHDLERTTPHAARVSRYRQAFDPRILGFATQSFGNYWYVNLTQLILPPSETEQIVSVERTGDKDLWKITRRYSTGDFTELWIDPVRQFNLVRKRTSGTVGERTTVDEIAIELAEFPSSDGEKVWFPAVIHRQVVRPEGTCCESIVRVDSAEFNRPVPEELFTLAGMELPIGTLVAVPKAQRTHLPRHPEIEQRHKRWDGDVLAPLSLEKFGRAASPVSAPPAPIAGRSRLWLFISINLMLFGLLLLILWSRRSRTS